MNRVTRKFATVVALSALLPLAMVIGVNALVDPYAMYRWVDIEGFNARKPAAYNRVRLLKAYEVRRRRPDSIVLGSSRVHLGIRPSHPGWAARFQRPYNLGFDGAMTKEMYAYLRHAHATGSLRHVMLGLDTYHLTDAPGTTRPGFDASVLLTGQPWLDAPRVLAADLRLLIGAGTLGDAWRTLRSQSGGPPRWLAADGQRMGEIFFRQAEPGFRENGPRGYFDAIDRMEIGFKLAWRIPAARARRPALAAPAPAADPVTSLGYVARIIDFCRREDLALGIFLTPSHAHQLELAAATGGWEAIEHGKRVCWPRTPATIPGASRLRSSTSAATPRSPRRRCRRGAAARSCATTGTPRTSRTAWGTGCSIACSAPARRAAPFPRTSAAP